MNILKTEKHEAVSYKVEGKGTFLRLTIDTGEQIWYQFTQTGWTTFILDPRVSELEAMHQAEVTRETP